jgi:pimeloyl-ACP methyl ester carboxylesterase
LSFGGVVALEAAKHLPTKGVFMIGGALTYRAIAWPFRLLCHAARIAPAWVVRVGLPLFPLALDLLEGLDDEHAKLYTQMAGEISPEIIRWGAASLIGWEFDRSQLPGVQIYVIHGERDEIIPLRRVRADHVVRGGRHLTSLKQANDVNRFIADVMRAGAASLQPAPVG